MILDVALRQFYAQFPAPKSTLNFSPPPRLVQWTNGEKTGKESENGEIEKLGAAGHDGKG